MLHMHATLSRACARLLSLAIALPVLLASERQQLPRVAEPHLHAVVDKQHDPAHDAPLPPRQSVVAPQAQPGVAGVFVVVE